MDTPSTSKASLAEHRATFRHTNFQLHKKQQWVVDLSGSNSSSPLERLDDLIRSVSDSRNTHNYEYDQEGKKHRSETVQKDISNIECGLSRNFHGCQDLNLPSNTLIETNKNKVQEKIEKSVFAFPEEDAILSGNIATINTKYGETSNFLAQKRGKQPSESKDNQRPMTALSKRGDRFFHEGDHSPDSVKAPEKKQTVRSPRDFLLDLRNSKSGPLQKPSKKLFPITPVSFSRQEPSSTSLQSSSEIKLSPGQCSQENVILSNTKIQQRVSDMQEFDFLPLVHSTCSKTFGRGNVRQRPALLYMEDGQGNDPRQDHSDVFTSAKGENGESLSLVLSSSESPKVELNCIGNNVDNGAHIFDGSSKSKITISYKINNNNNNNEINNNTNGNNEYNKNDADNSNASSDCVDSTNRIQDNLNKSGGKTKFYDTIEEDVTKQSPHEKAGEEKSSASTTFYSSLSDSKRYITKIEVPSRILLARRKLAWGCSSTEHLRGISSHEVFTVEDKVSNRDVTDESCQPDLNEFRDTNANFDLWRIASSKATEYLPIMEFSQRESESSFPLKDDNTITDKFLSCQFHSKSEGDLRRSSTLQARSTHTNTDAPIQDHVASASFDTVIFKTPHGVSYRSTDLGHCLPIVTLNYASLPSLIKVSDSNIVDGKPLKSCLKTSSEIEEKASTDQVLRCDSKQSPIFIRRRRKYRRSFSRNTPAVPTVKIKLGKTVSVFSPVESQTSNADPSNSFSNRSSSMERSLSNGMHSVRNFFFHRWRNAESISKEKERRQDIPSPKPSAEPKWAFDHHSTSKKTKRGSKKKRKLASRKIIHERTVRLEKETLCEPVDQVCRDSNEIDHIEHKNGQDARNDFSERTGQNINKAEKYARHYISGKSYNKTFKQTQKNKDDIKKKSIFSEKHLKKTSKQYKIFGRSNSFRESRSIQNNKPVLGKLKRSQSFRVAQPNDPNDMYQDQQEGYRKLEVPSKKVKESDNDIQYSGFCMDTALDVGQKYRNRERVTTDTPTGFKTTSGDEYIESHVAPEAKVECEVDRKDENIEEEKNKIFERYVQGGTSRTIPRKPVRRYKLKKMSTEVQKCSKDFAVSRTIEEETVLWIKLYVIIYRRVFPHV